jgi:outer membrane murein-binding lipoprotein Lpp
MKRLILAVAVLSGWFLSGCASVPKQDPFALWVEERDAMYEAGVDVYAIEAETQGLVENNLYWKVK